MAFYAMMPHHLHVLYYLNGRCEVTYSESLLQQIVPAYDLTDFAELLDRETLTDMTLVVVEMVPLHDVDHMDSRQSDSDESELDDYEESGRVSIGSGSSGMKLVKKGQIKVHKSVLAARSSVFEAMFTQASMREVNTNTVEIHDMEYDVVKQMVDFMYTGFVPSLDKYSLDLLFASEKYHLTTLGLLCQKYLMHHLTLNNVVDVLLASDLLNLTQLKSSCVDFLSKKGKDQIQGYNHLWESIVTNKISEYLCSNTTTTTKRNE